MKIGKRPKNIFYFSDGAAAQYKNFKNFFNIAFHFQDFGVEAEWHFFATSHGKGPCDGIGGTLKRSAKKASLQATLIETPEQLYQYLKGHTISTFVEYFDKNEWLQEELALNKRFSNARTVPGTRQMHSVCPSVREGWIFVRRFSASEQRQEVRVGKMIRHS